MGLKLEIPPGRTLTIRGTKKVIRKVQRVNATTHSYTIHVQMNASGKLASVIDSWTGYKQMMQLPEITKKRLKIIQLPGGTTSALQPADVYFNRQFKDFIRKVCNKVRWQHNDFVLAKRENLLNILDMLWYQFRAPIFENMLKYPWYRAGYTQVHPPEFQTPAQFCLGFKGYSKCEADFCPNFCFLRCAHCSLHFCFTDSLEHRDHMEF